MVNRFNVVVEQGEDGYLISEVVELSGCHTQAKTYDELMERTKEAISLYLKVKKPIEEKVIKKIKLTEKNAEYIGDKLKSEIRKRFE